MTSRQRSTYFGTLWPAACAAQNWNLRDHQRRRDVTFSATGKESTGDLNQSEITLLFNKLRWLADPSNFDKALADSDPASALDENSRKQVVWRIREKAQKAGLSEGWIQETSCAKCAAHNVQEWTQLSCSDLVKLSMTVASRTTAKARIDRSRRTSAKALQNSCITNSSESAPMPF